MPSPRDEYLARIHRVQDHVERHLAEELRLEDLARVACFSPFHFHRIFVALTGETVRAFVLRVRLERAASALLRSPERSITEIALDVGFAGPDTFARAFRAAYGVTASEYRKKRQALRKPGQAGAGDPPYGVASADAAPGGPVPAIGGSEPVMEIQAKKAAEAIEVAELPAFSVGYVRHVGPYTQDPELFPRLFGQVARWAGPRGLLGPEARWMAFFHDDPGVTAPEKLRISVGVTVPQGTQGAREVSVMEVPAGRAVVARFSLERGEYAAAWNWLMGEWMPQSGWQPDDRPCYEVYLSQPGDPVQRVELVEPVRPL